jgi:Concanavalin A-like lectin/glucanases superfamily
MRAVGDTERTVQCLAVLATLLIGCGFGSKVPTQNAPDADQPLPDAPPGDTTPVMIPTVRLITIAPGKVTGTHVDFPVLVAVSITSAHPMGFDIFFSADLGGGVKLAHEIERYQPNELVAWVKVPVLSQLTQIYLHYGDTTITTSQENPPAVWSASYAAVWHLSALADSTAANPAVATGSQAVTGKIANARSFDGAGDNLNVGSDTSIDNLFAGGGTMEAWVNATSYGEAEFGRIFDKAGVVLSMCEGNTGGEAAVLFSRGFSSGFGTWCTNANTLPLGAWTYVAVSYDDASTANVPAFFINGTAPAIGVSDTPQGVASSDGGQAMLIGDRAGGGRAFDGRIDEARFSTVRRSAEWIATSYENQRDPGAFFILSPAR